MTILVDANNWLRRRIEDDKSGLAPRSIANWINSSTEMTIFVFDGRGANERRRKIFPAYKSRRLPPGENIFKSISFIRDEVLPLTKAVRIMIEGWEADDVIATLISHVVKPIRIMSNDFDLKALEQIPGVTVDAKSKDHIFLDEIHLFKTWVGDPADAIPGVKGFGEGSWIKADKKVLAAITRAVEYNLQDEFNWEGVEIPERCKNWIMENPAELARMWNVTRLQYVDPNEIAENMKFGTQNIPAQLELFERYMQ